jgi:hypothetical protein
VRFKQFFNCSCLFLAFFQSYLSVGSVPTVWANSNKTEAIEILRSLYTRLNQIKALQPGTSDTISVQEELERFQNENWNEKETYEFLIKLQSLVESRFATETRWNHPIVDSPPTLIIQTPADEQINEIKFQLSLAEELKEKLASLNLNPIATLEFPPRRIWVPCAVVATAGVIVTSLAAITCDPPARDVKLSCICPNGSESESILFCPDYTVNGTTYHFTLPTCRSVPRKSIASCDSNFVLELGFPLSAAPVLIPTIYYCKSLISPRIAQLKIRLNRWRIQNQYTLCLSASDQLIREIEEKHKIKYLKEIYEMLILQRHPLPRAANFPTE